MEKRWKKVKSNFKRFKRNLQAIKILENWQKRWKQNSIPRQ